MSSIEFCPNNLKTLQFENEYDYAPYHGNYMLNPYWQNKPYLANIGLGFSVEPSLPSKFPGYYLPTLPSALNLIVYGPGLPSKGKELVFAWWFWYVSVGYDLYKGGTLDFQVLTAGTASSVFTLKFYAGYTEQPLDTTKKNLATWDICYTEPSESKIYTTKKKPPHPWDMGIMPFTDLAQTKIEKCESSSQCDTDIDALVGVITSVGALVAEVSWPKNQENLRRRITEKLGSIKAELDEADSLVKNSNEIESRSKRRQMRNAAIVHLEKARYLKNEVYRMFSYLEEVLVRTVMQ